MRKKESELLYVIDEEDETDFDRTPLSSGAGHKRRHVHSVGDHASANVGASDNESEEDDDDDCDDDDEEEMEEDRIKKSVAAGLVVGGASTVGVVPAVGENGTEEGESEDEEEVPDW